MRDRALKGAGIFSPFRGRVKVRVLPAGCEPAARRTIRRGLLPVERQIDAQLDMAIFKSEAQVLDEAGRPVGHGTVYVHLQRGLEREQEGGGTISLKSWTPTDRVPRALQLADGRRLDIRVSRDALSDCSSNRVLRFEAHWPPGRVA